MPINLISRFGVFCVVLLVLVPSGRAQSFASPVGDSDNAADHYRSAFKTMLSLQKESRERLSAWDKIALDGSASSLIKQAISGATHVVRGAQAPRCDWRFDYDAPFRGGFFDPVGYDVNGIEFEGIELVKDALLLRARYYFETGRKVEAVADLVALRAMGRQIGLVNLERPVVAGMGCEYGALRYLATHLTGIDDARLEQVAAQSATLPAWGGMKQLVLHEKRLRVGWLAQNFRDDNYEELIRRRAFNQCATGQVITEAQLPYVGAYLLPHFVEAERMFDQYAEASTETWHNFQTKEKSLESIKDGAPVWGKQVAPSLYAIRSTYERSVAQSAMFDAAILLLRHGEAAFHEVRDTHGDGPFKLRRVGDGFVLSSQLTDSSGVNLTLRVGVPLD